jgi:hypothetical protein
MCCQALFKHGLTPLKKQQRGQADEELQEPNQDLSIQILHFPG